MFCRVYLPECKCRELRAAAGGAGGSGSATVAELTDQLDVSQRQLTTTQQKYQDAQKQIRDLKEQLSEAAGAGGASSAAATSTARSDAEISSLKKEVEALQSRLQASQQATKQAQTQAAEAKAAVAAAEAKAAVPVVASGGSDAAGGANPTQVVLGNPSASQTVLLSKLAEAESYGRAMKAHYEKEHANYTAAAMKLKNSERQRMMFAEAITKYAPHHLPSHHSAQSEPPRPLPSRSVLASFSVSHFALYELD